MRSRAACAERVSFQSRASRMTRPSASRATMPCCCPAIETAATSSRPPAWAMASCSATHHASGSTEVPAGCDARPSRTTRPVSASTTTTLHDCVDESTPMTSAMLTLPLRRPDCASAPRTVTALAGRCPTVVQCPRHADRARTHPRVLDTQRRPRPRMPPHPRVMDTRGRGRGPDAMASRPHPAGVECAPRAPDPRRLSARRAGARSRAAAGARSRSPCRRGTRRCRSPRTPSGRRSGRRTTRPR